MTAAANSGLHLDSSASEAAGMPLFLCAEQSLAMVLKERMPRQIFEHALNAAVVSVD